MRKIWPALRTSLMAMALGAGALAHAQGQPPIKVGVLTPIRTVLGV